MPNQLLCMSEDEKTRLAQELEDAKSMAKEYESRYKYLLAEYDNYRKRLEKEMDIKVKRSIEGIILRLLDLRDDYIRAIDTAKRESSKSLIAGLEGILKRLDGILKEYGVVEIDALGKSFDPNLHEAVSFVYDRELPDLTVTNEIRKGYIWNDRVIRPSLVEVSKRPEGGDSKDG
jgi:molecular chaperone GrpE